MREEAPVQGPARLRAVWDGQPDDIPADVIDPPLEPGIEQRVVDCARLLPMTEARATLDALHGVYVQAVREVWGAQKRAPAAEPACREGLSRVLVWAARASRGTDETPWQIAVRMVRRSVCNAGEYGQHVAKAHTMWGSVRDGTELTRLGQLEAESRPLRAEAPLPASASPVLDREVQGAELDGQAVIARREGSEWWVDTDAGRVPVVVVERLRSGRLRLAHREVARA